MSDAMAIYHMIMFMFNVGCFFYIIFTIVVCLMADHWASSWMMVIGSWSQGYFVFSIMYHYHYINFDAWAGK